MAEDHALVRATLAAAIIVSRGAKSLDEIAAAWADADTIIAPQWTQQERGMKVEMPEMVTRRLDGKPAYLVSSKTDGSHVARVRVGGKERLMTISGWNALPIWDGPSPSTDPIPDP